MGTYLPEKGMHQITEELVALAERKGVKFHYNQPVERILTNQKKAQGIATAAGEVPADLVVCDMDIFPAYKKLMPEVPMPKRLATQEPSSSALIFYWGIGQHSKHWIYTTSFFRKIILKNSSKFFHKMR